MTRHDVRARLWHALEAARVAVRMTTGRTSNDYSADEMLRLAVERALTIIGEALSAVRRDNPELAEQIPYIHNTVGLRNILVHGYAEIDDDVVWNTVDTDLPDLVRVLEELLTDLAYLSSCRSPSAPSPAPPLAVRGSAGGGGVLTCPWLRS